MSWFDKCWKMADSSIMKDSQRNFCRSVLRQMGTSPNYPTLPQISLLKVFWKYYSHRAEMSPAQKMAAEELGEE